MRWWVTLAVLVAGTIGLTACGSSASESDAGPTESAAGEARASAPADPPEAPPDSSTTERPDEGPEPEPDAPAGPNDAAPLDSAEIERVVRAWSAALNAGNNEAAAELFASGAIVVQGGSAFELSSREAAVAFNSGLPCSGTIVDFSFLDGAILVTFELGDRPESECDAQPGSRAAAVFVVENGLIELWQQVPVPGDSPPPDSTLT